MKTDLINKSAFFILLIIGQLLPGCKKNESDPTKVIDKDGNSYNIITLGTQKWMKENLRTTKYNDGSTITEVTADDVWKTTENGALCWYNNDAAKYKESYGALYNWYTVGTGKLCPAGWHVPTKDDWTNLIFYEAGYLVAGGRLKEADTTHWASPDGIRNFPDNNESGFTALPGGYRSNSFFYGCKHVQ